MGSKLTPKRWRGGKPKDSLQDSPTHSPNTLRSPENEFNDDIEEEVLHDDRRNQSKTKNEPVSFSTVQPILTNRTSSPDIPELDAYPVEQLQEPTRKASTPRKAPRTVVATIPLDVRAIDDVESELDEIDLDDTQLRKKHPTKKVESKTLSSPVEWMDPLNTSSGMNTSHTNYPLSPVQNSQSPIILGAGKKSPYKPPPLEAQAIRKHYDPSEPSSPTTPKIPELTDYVEVSHTNISPGHQSNTSQNGKQNGKGWKFW